MKPNIIKILFALTILFSASPAHSGLVQFFTAENQDWGFIQSVGGMKVSAKDSTLTVDCDVSGTKQITVKPTMVNSGLGVRKVKHKRQDNTILLTVVTCVFGNDNPPVPKPLDLSACPAGEYSVEYLDRNGARHPVGKITLKK